MLQMSLFDSYIPYTLFIYLKDDEKIKIDTKN